MRHFRRASSRRGGRADTRLTTRLPPSRGTLFVVLLVRVKPAHGWAYRPFISTHAALADPHEVEIEFGYFTLEHDQGENTFTILGLVLNYGLRRDIGEVAGENTKGGLPHNSALLGVTWPPMAAPVFLDARVRRGISRDAPDWQFTAGVTMDVSLTSGA